MAKRKKIESAKDIEAKADQIASDMLTKNDLVRDVELEVIREDDPRLHKMVASKLVAMKSKGAEEPSSSTINTMADIDKLPPEAREAAKSLVEQLGGIPKGGMFQIKLDSVKSMDTAIDAMIINGSINLGSIVCTHLATEKTGRIGRAIVGLVKLAHDIKEKDGKPSASDKKTLDNIDQAIKATFGGRDLNAALRLCKELGLNTEPKDDAADSKTK